MALGFNLLRVEPQRRHDARVRLTPRAGRLLAKRIEHRHDRHGDGRGHLSIDVERDEADARGLYRVMRWLDADRQDPTRIDLIGRVAVATRYANAPRLGRWRGLDRRCSWLSRQKRFGRDAEVQHQPAGLTRRRPLLAAGRR